MVDVLLVEDTSTQAIIMQQMLISAGQSVQIKKSAEDALSFLESEKPSIILTDINLPEMDGYEMSRKIKADPSLKDVPVVLLVALKNRDEIVEIIESNADSFMLKLLRKDYFIPTFQEILKNTRDSANPVTAAIKIEGKEIYCRPQNILNMLLSCVDIVVNQQRQTVDSK
ncbi:MAG: response regulator [Candidatus Obscuribacterales bacterium]|nr:response regulator [Candidatus Obscuribacterales bacterium]